MMGRSMVGRKLFLAVAFSCGAFLGMAQGQQTQELTAIIGRTIISDHGVTGVSTFDPILHSGKGLSLELNYAHKLKSMELFSFAVEVPVLFNFRSAETQLPRTCPRITNPSL